MWALMIGGALAQSWDVQRLYRGTNISGANGDVAAAIAITGSAELGRLYFALVRETPDGPGRSSTLYLGTLDCPGWTGCMAPTLVQVGSPQTDAGPLPSIAIREIPDGEPLIHVVHSVSHGSCAVPIRRIEEDVYDPLTGTFENRVVREPGGCADGQLSHTVVADDQVWSCWSEDPPTGGLDNQVYCGTRDLLDPAGSWTTALLADGRQTRDHSWFTVVDGIRYVVLRNRDPSPDAIDLHADGLVGHMPDPTPVQEADFPSIAHGPDGSLHAVWVEDRRRVSYARCEAGLDCADTANWALQPFPVRTYRTGPLDHPEIVISESGRMFVFWSEDHNPAALDQRRIHVKEKCLSDPLFSPATDAGQVVRDIGNNSNDQTLLLGRPHTWVDELSQTIHLAFLEKNHPGPHPTHGDAFWAKKPIDPCP